MSSGSGSGRLPSLNSSGAPALKFKPKFIARRTKEEREASAPKVKQEDSQVPSNDRRRGNYSDKKATGPGNQQRRLARYLNNTHVITSGPLAAGNFVSDKSGDMKRSFIKSEGGSSSLVHKGLQTIDTADVEADSDEDDGDNGDTKDKASDGERKAKSKFNMGREYTVHELKDKNDAEEDSDSDVNMDEEAWQAKKVEELFPIRPIRIRHDDLDTVQKEIKDSFSEGTTREPTPLFQIKTEGDDTIASGNGETGLQNILKTKVATLNERIKQLNLQQQFHSLDEKESLQELKNLADDHTRIWKKINRINNKPKRFVLLQLPSKLPNFEEITPKAEKQETSDIIPTGEEAPSQSQEGEDETPVEIKAKKILKHKSKENDFVEPNSLAGKIGSIRIHKSGRLSVKIGNVVMDINRGAETTFLQDVVSLNDSAESPSVEVLGRLDGRFVVTPRF